MAFATLSNLFAARCSSLIVALTCVFNCVFCELLVYRWCCPIVCFSLPSLDNRVYKTGSATPTFTGWLWSQFTRAIATTSPVYCRHQPRECDVLSKWYLALWSAWFVFIFTESRTTMHCDACSTWSIDFPDKKGSRSETRLHRSWVLETMRWGCNVREQTQSNKRSAVVGATTKTTTMEVRWSTAAMQRRSVKAEGLVDGFPTRNRLQGSRWKPADAKRQSDS